MKKSTKSEMREWEVQNALRTLQNAKEIESNTSLYNDVKKYAKKQAEELMKLGGAISSPKKRSLKKSSSKKTLKRK